MIELIGTNAGLVWNDMYAAFGWLAKEGKLAFEEIEGEMYVSLV